MKILDIQKMKSKRSTGVPVLRVAKNKVSFGSSLVEHLNLDGDDNIYLQFGTDEDALNIRVCKKTDENSAEFIKRSNQQWELYNSGVANYIRKLSGSEENSIPCRVTNANDEGWYPVITTYWKTISNQ